MSSSERVSSGGLSRTPSNGSSGSLPQPALSEMTPERRRFERIKELMTAQTVGTTTKSIVSLVKTQEFCEPAEFVNRWDLVYHATMCNLPELVRSLVKILDVDINKRFGQRKMTALHVAASRGYRKIIQVLLRHQADPDIRNSAGQLAVATCHNAHTRTFLLREIEKKNHLYSQFVDLQFDFTSLQHAQRQMEQSRISQEQQLLQVQHGLERSNEQMESNEKKIIELKKYIKRLKEQGQEDEAALREYEHVVIPGDLAIERKITIGLQLVRGMSVRNRKMKEYGAVLDDRMDERQEEISRNRQVSKRVQKELTLMRTDRELRLREQSVRVKKLSQLVRNARKQNKLYCRQLVQGEGKTQQRQEELDQQKETISAMESSVEKYEETLRDREGKMSVLIDQARDATREHFELSQTHSDLRFERKKKSLEGRFHLKLSPDKQRVLAQKREIAALGAELSDWVNRNRILEMKAESLHGQLEDKGLKIQYLSEKIASYESGKEGQCLQLQKLMSELAAQVKELEESIDASQEEQGQIRDDFQQEKEDAERVTQREKDVNAKWEAIMQNLQGFRQEELQQMIVAKPKLSFELRRRERRLRRNRKARGLSPHSSLAGSDANEIFRETNDRLSQRCIDFLKSEVTSILKANEELQIQIQERNDVIDQMKGNIEEAAHRAEVYRDEIDRRTHELEKKLAEMEVEGENLKKQYEQCRGRRRGRGRRGRGRGRRRLSPQGSLRGRRKRRRGATRALLSHLHQRNSVEASMKKIFGS